ncbi:MAG: AbrB/MazE/SpoVT family DNA-binding domain-containing protein, partial [Deltaproteobacteria bacterium]|nr:AbrB/MazE/SpoVT family DNA-binding domain-containing protein [Deltaproteobacteria bacterium]
MLSTKISSKGQVVVPKEIRTKLKIKPGTFFHVQIEKNNIILAPMKKRPIERLYG